MTRLTAALLLLTHASLTQAAPTKLASPSKLLLGVWESPAGEIRPGAGRTKLFLKRQFTITKDESRAHFEFFEDEKFKVKTMVFDFGGKYQILSPSKKVPGATEANFPIEYLKITPLVPGTVGWLNSAPAGTCGSQPWKVGVAQDLAATKGCALFGIRTGETVEHDIFKVAGDKLSFGARPTDGSLLDTEEKRPRSFQVPVVRKAP